MKKNSKETKLQNAIATYLQYNQYTVIRLNSGAMVNEKSKQYFRAYYIYNMKSSAGIADLLVIKKDKYFFLEIKVDKNVLTKSQKEFQHYCNENEIPYYIVYSLEEVESLLTNIKYFERD